MKENMVLLLTSDPTSLTYDDYLDWCENNEVEPQDENSNSFYEWCGEEAYMIYNDERDNLSYSKLANRMFLVDGTLGLWWGKPAIVPQVCRGLLETIDKCIGNDIDNIDVKADFENGLLVVYAYHHDGTNVFNLRMLNKNGEKWAESAENRGDNIIYNQRWWTKIKKWGDIFEC